MELSRCYRHGIGTYPDEKRAFECIEKAAELGYIFAQIAVANCYGEGKAKVPLAGLEIETEPNKSKAVEWYKKIILRVATEKMIVEEAKARLAKIEEKESSPTQSTAIVQSNTITPIAPLTIDWNTPVDVLKAEATKDNPDALYYLGIYYANGNKGLPKDRAKTTEFWQRAAKTADNGLPAAQTCRALCYSFGYGVDKDEKEAVKWYRKAAEQGYAVAQHNLGNCYLDGDGVPQDKEEAAKWYHKAAEQGLGVAQSNLGVCYANGEGVPRNSAESIRWYRKAAEQELPDAQYGLGIHYMEERDFEEAAKWFRKAAEHGSAKAQYNLGVCYFNGLGVSRNYTEAVKWYRRAAEQGLPAAQIMLRKLDY